MKRLFVVLLPVLLGAGGKPSPCPEDMVLVSATKTCIDRYEWPNKRGERPATALSATASPYDPKGSVLNAEALCASVGKRPCEMTEWVAACRGRKGADYPFGRKLPKEKPTPAEARCNYAQHFIEPDEYKVFLRDPDELARLNKSDPSGTRGCVSASGAEDMMGNVEEWIRCPKWLNKNEWCLAGRFWSEGVPCTKMAAGHSPTWHYYETGHRCCLDI